MTRSTVEYWEKWGGKEREAMASVVDAFNSSQGDYEVVMRDTGDWSSSPDLPRFLAAHMSGTPPDIIGLEDHQVIDLAASGALTPIEMGFRLDWCRDEFTSLGAWGGVLYAAPVAVDVATLYVNLDAVRGTTFERGGLPGSLEEFSSGLASLESKGIIGLVPAYPGWWPQVWAWFFGGSWVNEAGAFTPSCPGNIQAFEWVQGIREMIDRCGRTGVFPWLSGAFAKPVNPIGSTRPDPFLTGRVAMVFEGDWLVNRLVATPNLAWRPVAFPSIDGVPSALIVGDLLAIPSGAAHQAGALDFIRFATLPEHLERLALGQGKVSPLVRWSAEFIGRHRNPRICEFRDLLASARLLHDPRVPGWLGYLERIKEAFGAVWSGQKSPRESLR